MAERNPEMLARCIRLNLDCADLCSATAKIIGRQDAPNREVIAAALDACRLVCARCAEECEKHAHMMKHCQICAEACRRCEQACRDLAAAQ